MEFKGLTERCKKVNTFTWSYKVVQNFCLGIMIMLFVLSLHFLVMELHSYLAVSLVGVVCFGAIYLILNYFYGKILRRIMFKNTDDFYMEILKDLPRRILKQPTDSEKEDAIKRIIDLLTKICTETFHQSKVFAKNYYEICSANLLVVGITLALSEDISEDVFSSICSEIEKFISGETFKK